MEQVLSNPALEVMLFSMGVTKAHLKRMWH